MYKKLTINNQPISIMVRVLNRGSIAGWVIPMTLDMVLDASLLNSQHYKVEIKSMWSNPEKWVAPFGVIAIEKAAFELPSTVVGQFTTTYIYIYIYITLSQK